MDVDEDDSGTQRPKSVSDYGVEVDFETLDEEDREVRCTNDYIESKNTTNIASQDESGETLAEIDASITKLNGDIERMAPNLKAIERCATHVVSFMVSYSKIFLVQAR